MALWLFRRRSRRKRPLSGTQPEGEGHTSNSHDDPLSRMRSRRRQTDPELSATAPVKKQRTESNKLHRRERTYSFDEGKDDDLKVDHLRSRKKRGTRSTPPRFDPRAKEVDLFNPDDTALREDVFPRMPTLHNKRNGDQLVGKKSRKRRKADHDREAEIKAMSNFVPLRPATEQWQTGRPIKRDVRRVKTGLGLGFRKSWEREHPSSDVSLPMPGSIHSSLSSDSEQLSFKVSTLEALAPRPTLRYAIYPRYNSPSPGSGPRRTNSQRRKLLEKEPISEATLRAHKRVDDLADDLSASDLRELMERDQRRRERKRQRDQEKIERRLARRAEKEKAAQREGRQSRPNMDRGVLGRDHIGLGIGPESAVVTSSRRSSFPSSKQLGKRPEGPHDVGAADEAHRGPLDNFHRTDSVPLNNATMTAPDGRTAAQPNALDAPQRKDLLRLRKTRSKSPPSSEPSKTDLSGSLRKNSDGSSAKGGLSWSSIFRWGNRGKRNSGPSSFSNTSRDSMSAAHTPTAPIPIVVPRKASNGMPKRTLSRFREDLPELPLSPPQSRIQSPEADSMPPAILEQDSPLMNAEEDQAQPIQIQRETPSLLERHTDETSTSVDPSPKPVAMSLGSIDSEGSWFGGRTATRRRSANVPLSPPHSRQHFHRHTASNGSSDTHHDPDLPQQEVLEDEGAFIADDDYLSHFANQRSSGSQWRESTGEARPSSDEDDDAHWGSVGGRQPTVVQPHRVDLVKSREGLLNTFTEEEGSYEDSTSGVEKDADATEEDQPTELERATSIRLGQKHARHISAGSAKLLDITPRSSVDAKKKI